MAAEYKLKDLTGLNLQPGQMQEADVEGIEDGKVLLVHSLGKVHALSPKCTHYGAPLKNGVVTSEGRLTCPWHGGTSCAVKAAVIYKLELGQLTRLKACFNVASGDVEDAPALDPIANFDIVEKGGAVYIRGDEQTIKASRKTLDISCSANKQDKVVVIGGGSGGVGAIEGLRKYGFKGHITVISAEGTQPYDRTKLSKALMADISKVAWRSKDYYKGSDIDIVGDEVTSLDFTKKSVATKSGQSYPYTKLILAMGGTPKSLPLPGLKEGELQNVFLIRSLDHTQAIVSALGSESPKKIVVIGSSFIGMEVANCLAGMKHDVSCIGMESEPCEAVFGAKLGKVFRGLLEKNGVKFYMSAQVSNASPSSSDKNKVGAVHLKDGKELPAEIVIEGVGVGPATGFLKDAPGGPQLEKDGSIRVDDTFAVPGLNSVYAVGDIATYPYKGVPVRIEHWNVALNSGRSVAQTIAKGTKPKEFTPVFWSALGSQLRYCGNTGASGGYDDVIIDGDTSKPSFAAYYVKGQDVVAVATMGKDPIMSKCAELMRQGNMLSRSDLEGGKSPLEAKL
ncbi:MAG: hypothetical protein M1828_002334 [Chrysothrix sp. TS-e1954]|nr:MAG: hypothetical protein M1828_002334 [Chrysothrix sp. TS-e1954]